MPWCKNHPSTLHEQALQQGLLHLESSRASNTIKKRSFEFLFFLKKLYLFSCTSPYITLVRNMYMCTLLDFDQKRIQPCFDGVHKIIGIMVNTQQCALFLLKEFSFPFQSILAGYLRFMPNKLKLIIIIIKQIIILPINVNISIVQK